MDIIMYGADWCGDCIRTKRQLDDLDIGYDYRDIVAEPSLAEDAEAISGRKNIPVVVYPDGTHQVEPSNPDVEAKLRELGMLGQE